MAKRFPLQPKILVADDNPAIRAAVQELLEEHSFEVCGQATNGKEAIEEVIELRPDVILLDIRMPVMNGFAAAAAIRLVSPVTKIVFLTLYDPDAFSKEAQLCADGFVSKFEAGKKLIPTLDRLAPASEIRNLKYLWQKVVADAFRAPAGNLHHKINAAERAISARLVKIDPAEKDEQRALKEALQALGQLLSETTPGRNFTKNHRLA
jgi:DNA-binding NarL/FixJ family response regulator